MRMPLRAGPLPSLVSHRNRWSTTGARHGAEQRSTALNGVQRQRTALRDLVILRFRCRMLEDDDFGGNSILRQRAPFTLNALERNWSATSSIGTQRRLVALELLGFWCLRR